MRADRRHRPDTDPVVFDDGTDLGPGSRDRGGRERTTGRDRPQDEWWADFSQYLSPEALYVWDGVHANRVSASGLTGEPIATVADATFVSVIVPTDARSYRLAMAKRVDGTDAGTWLVFEMTAPEFGS